MFKLIESLILQCKSNDQYSHEYPTITKFKQEHTTVTHDVSSHP